MIAYPAPQHTYRPLLPLLLLVALEVLLAVWIALIHPPHLRPFNLLTSAMVLLSGLLPALLRPSPDSARVGSFAVLLASLIWQISTIDISTFPGFTILAQVLDDPRPALSMSNTGLLIPVALHITARFPRRSTISDRQLFGAYLFTAGLELAILLVPPLRVGMLYALAIEAYLLLSLAGGLLVRAIRDPLLANQRAVIQARLIFVSFLLAESPLLAMPVAQIFGANISYTTLLATQIFFPVGIAYAITRHDLFDIDAALRRTLAYAMISLSLLAIYLGLTSALTMLLQETHRPLFATVIGILIAALAFPWMSTRAQLLITRAFYPERLSFQRDIEAAQAALARVLRRDEVLHLLTVDLPSRLDAPQAGLSLAPEPPTVPPGAAWSSDLLVGGRRIGSYWLGARRSGLAFAPHEREWLQALAQQAALALAYAETVAELEALNRELEDRVTARTEQLLAHQRELVAIAERQRLARDLHDSLKQSLFSLGLSLHAARLLLPRDPEATGALLREQEALAIQAQSELGALLSDLREATPRRGDLAEALRQECARLAQRHQLQVTLDAPDQFILEEPARSELAAIAREALHNVLKHSGVGVARVQLAQIGDTLQLTVVDQGRGFDQAARASIGHGLRGMAERAAALGGTLTVTSGAGEGTRICAQIPSTTAPAL